MTGNTTALKAIRAKCLDCCLGSTNEVKLCPSADCALYPFRLGKNPNRTGIGNKNPNTTGLAKHRNQ